MSTRYSGRSRKVVIVVVHDDESSYRDLVSSPGILEIRGAAQIEAKLGPAKYIRRALQTGAVHLLVWEVFSSLAFSTSTRFSRPKYKGMTCSAMANAAGNVGRDPT